MVSRELDDSLPGKDLTFAFKYQLDLNKPQHCLLEAVVQL